MSNEPEPVDWPPLVARLIHPTKVVILEALAWINRPLSSVELSRVFDETIDLSNVWYHVWCLEKADVLTPIGERQRRGATETFYDFRRANDGRPSAS